MQGIVIGVVDDSRLTDAAWTPTVNYKLINEIFTLIDYKKAVWTRDWCYCEMERGRVALGPATLETRLLDFIIKINTI